MPKKMPPDIEKVHLEILERGARDTMASMVSLQLVKLVETIRQGIATFEPDERSMRRIEQSAEGLVEAMRDARLLKADHDVHYMRRNRKFQAFLKDLNLKEA